MARISSASFVSVVAAAILVLSANSAAAFPQQQASQNSSMMLPLPDTSMSIANPIVLPTIPAGSSSTDMGLGALGGLGNPVTQSLLTMSNPVTQSLLTMSNPFATPCPTERARRHRRDGDRPWDSVLPAIATPSPSYGGSSGYGNKDNGPLGNLPSAGGSGSLPQSPSYGNNNGYNNNGYGSDNGKDTNGNGYGKRPITGGVDPVPERPSNGEGKPTTSCTKTSTGAFTPTMIIDDASRFGAYATPTAIGDPASAFSSNGASAKSADQQTVGGAVSQDVSMLSDKQLSSLLSQSVAPSSSASRVGSSLRLSQQGVALAGALVAMLLLF